MVGAMIWMWLRHYTEVVQVCECYCVLRALFYNCTILLAYSVTILLWVGCKAQMNLKFIENNWRGAGIYRQRFAPRRPKIFPFAEWLMSHSMWRMFWKYAEFWLEFWENSNKISILFRTPDWSRFYKGTITYGQIENSNLPLSRCCGDGFQRNLSRFCVPPFALQLHHSCVAVSPRNTYLKRWKYIWRRLWGGSITVTWR